MSTVVTGTPEELFTESFLQFIRSAFSGKRLRVEIEEEMDETDFILRDPIMRERILKSVDEINNGDYGQSFTLDELRSKFNVPEA